MQGNWTLLGCLHSDHIPNGKFIPIFPRWNLKASSEAYVISFRCTTKLKQKKCPGYQRSSDLAASNLVHRWISLKIWERHNENSKSQQRVCGIDHLLLLSDVLHCLISGPSHVKFSLCCHQPKKKRNITRGLCNYLDSTGLYARTFLCSQRISVHLLLSIRKNEITMRVLGFFYFMCNKYISTNK